MLEWIQQALNFIFETLLAEFIVVVVGVITAQLILSRWEKWRYGGWHVIIIQDGQVKVDRHISASKVRAILAEPADLSVFLKGVASPYAWIRNVDLVEDGQQLGILVRDERLRTFTLDLDKIPAPQSQPTPPQFEHQPDE